MAEYLTSKVRKAWRLFSASKAIDREPNENEKQKLSQVLSELVSIGFKVTNNLHMFEMPAEIMKGYKSKLNREDNHYIWATLIHLRDNIKWHTTAYSPDGKHIGKKGGYIISRFKEQNKQYIFELYVFDKGVGFPNNSEGKPRIEEAIKEYVSLGPASLDGIGLYDVINGADFWEIECRGYRLRESKFERLPIEPIEGVMVHIIKYLEKDVK